MNKPVAFVLTVLLMIGGCSTRPMSPSSQGDNAAVTPSFSQVSDVPIPVKATMDVDHSLLLGHGDAWVGRLVYTTWTGTGDVYDLYRAQMPAFGWQEITSIRGPVSVQTWSRGDRVATVQIQDTTFGSEVSLTIAPAVNGAQDSSRMIPPSPVAAPSPAVSRQPLQ